jgi:diguanylate cyclase (GGDEF)-like protein/PAS domain S-box-containing protein
MNPLSVLLRFWSHLGLLKRLVVALGLLILVGATMEMVLMVRNGAAAYRTQHREQARELSQFLAPLLAEQIVVGDYATIRQLLTTQVEDRIHVERLDWIGANGKVLSAESLDVKPQAPRWFAALADIPPLKESASVVLGGQNYGELVIAFTPVAAENALWAQLTGQVMERVLVVALSFLTIILILRGNLATVDRLAQGADRFSRGDHAVRIPARGAPEVRAAAHAFNNMAAQLSTFVTNLSESRRELHEQLHFTQELIEALPNPIFFKDRDGVYLGVNKAWEEFFGIPRAEFIGKTVQNLYPDVPDVAALHDKMDQTLWNQPGQQMYEATVTAADGRPHHMIYYKAAFTRADGTVAGLIGMMVDITEHKNAQDALQRSQDRLAEAQRIARLGNWEWNIVTGELHWSDEVYRIFGLTSHESGVNYEAFLGRVHPDDRQYVLAAVDKALHEHEPYRAEYRILQPDKTERVVHEQGEVTFNADGKPLRMIGTVQDVTEHKQAQERLSYLAYYDTLTGLPNRVMLVERMQQAMAESRRVERVVAIMFLDLDRFKFINDTLGHDIGDALLKMAAERLSALLRPGDTISRYGGDEFTVVLANVAHADDVTRIAQKILERFAHPFRIGGRDLFVTSSIGITLYPLDDGSVENLLKNADAAMYHAKERGRNTFQFYTAEMNVRAARRLSIETGLRHALERNELSLHYQPQVDLKSGHLYGMEALLRWHSPEFGSVAPVEFIPLAEEIGLIQPIGEWVLRTACVQTRAWHQAGFPGLRIGVNLSARQFQQPNLVQLIRQALTDSGLEPQHLDLELTESMLMHDMERTVSTLTELDTLGVALSVDDFGTGYSSLSYLKRFPIDVLKIDRSFVRDITSDPDDAAIATAIIAMAHSLEMKVIAEGVETREQQEFLRQHDCDGMQGYLFSKPLPAEDFTRLLQKNQRLWRVPGSGGTKRGHFPV